jgi:hypothetical protein
MRASALVRAGLGLALAFVLLAPDPAVAGAPPPAPTDDAERVAIEYLKALSGEGDPKARGYLLGGVPLAAREYKIPNWNIVARDPPKTEQGDIALLRGRLDALDLRARKALSGALAGEKNGADRKRAQELLAATRDDAKKLATEFPVVGYVLRADKDVFWHPDNPMRRILRDVEPTGRYAIELHLFRVEERDGEKPPRVWPLRVMRMTTTNGLDTGFKVLPASHWDPEY